MTSFISQMGSYLTTWNKSNNGRHLNFNSYENEEKIYLILFVIAVILGLIVYFINRRKDKRE